MTPQICSAANTSKTTDEKKTKPKLYIIGLSGVESIYKIGISVNPHRRLKQLQTGCPFLLKLMWTMGVPNAQEMEKRLHMCLKASHVSGEWYKIDGDVVGLVTSLLPQLVGQEYDPTVVMARVTQADNPTITVVQSMVSVMKDQLTTMNKMLHSMTTGSHRSFYPFKLNTDCK